MNWKGNGKRGGVLPSFGAGARVLIHDHDAKYVGSADRVVEAAGIRVIKTPIAAPKANAHMERQIGSGRRECFDWMLILSRRHLERVTGEWIEHYNEARPHRGLDLRTPIARSDPVDAAAGFANIRVTLRCKPHDQRQMNLCALTIARNLPLTGT